MNETKETQVLAAIDAKLEERRASAPAKSTSPEKLSDPASLRAIFPNLMAELERPPAEDAALAEKRAAAAERQERKQLADNFFDHDDAARRVYGKCLLENYAASRDDQTLILAAVMEYQLSIVERIASKEGLVLYGPCGTGKDHLAIAVCLHAIREHGLSALRINGCDWFGEIRDRMDDDNAQSEKSMIGKLGAPDLLLVSDPLPPIGSLTQHQATMLYRLVERRYFAGKVTLVTVNVADDDEAEQRMGVPTWDRLSHRAWKCRCYWPSHRQPARTFGVR